MENTTTEPSLWTRTKNFVSENRVMCVIICVLIVIVVIAIVVTIVSYKSKSVKKETFEGTNSFNDEYSYVKSYIASTLGEGNLV